MRITPDGRRYLRMAAGECEPMPFHLRWLLPWVLGQRGWAWVLATWAGVLGTLTGTTALGIEQGLTSTQAVVAGALVAGLPSLRFCLSAPVLVNMPALAFSAWTGALWSIWPELAIAVVFIGAMVCEKVPVFGALFAWSPWPLVALGVPLLRWLTVRAGPIRAEDPHASTLRDPLETGLAAHAGLWRRPEVMLLPWGACLFAGLAEPSWALGLVLLVGYAQLFVATDTVRLYQQAAPFVAVVAAAQIPEAWVVPVLVAHWMNPWAGEGI